MSPVSVVPFLPDETTQVVPPLSKSGGIDLQNTIYLQHFRRKNTLKRRFKPQKGTPNRNYG
jgi:hypothetical protein